MKILLILPEINSGCQWNVGLAYISAVLKKHGHDVELFEMVDYKKDLPSILTLISDYRPKLIGVTANSHQFIYVKKLAADIKKKFNIPFFVGGVHVTLRPETLYEEPAIDGICRGEGEFQFLELAERIEKDEPYFDLRNFWFRKGEEIVKNNLAQLPDLDALPMPDRSIFSYFKIPGQKIPRFIFSRGCPYECTYCCNHAFKKNFMGLGQYVRWRGVDLALAEIEAEKQKYDFDYFKLDDDTFSLNKEWLKEFCEKIAAKNWGMTFECNVRPGTIDEEGMRLLKKAGCVMVKIGVEAGNTQQRKNVLKRYFSNEDIIKTFDLAKKFGVKTFSFNMIGVPGETLETIKDTIRLNARIKPDFMQVTAFYPYPETVLGQDCVDKGYVERDFEDSYMEKSILNLPTITKRQIERAVKNFKFNVYWPYNKKRAVGEELEIIKKYIIKNSVLHWLAKLLYKPYKIIKK